MDYIDLDLDLDLLFLVLESGLIVLYGSIISFIYSVAT